MLILLLQWGVERVEEEDTHHNAVIVDPTIETAPPKHNVPAAAMGVESVDEEDTHHDAMIVDTTIETALPRHTIPAAVMGVESVEEEDTQHNTAIVDALIVEPSSVIEEPALTALVENITTQQHVAPEKHLEESVIRPEEAPKQELTLRDLLEIQKAAAEDDATSVKTIVEKPLIVQQCLESTSVHKQLVIVLVLEKPGDKESVVVPRELEMEEWTLRDLADSDEYLHFTPPSFDLLSQDQPQQAEIHGEQRKAAGLVKESSSQDFGEEIIYTQGTLNRLDKEMNDVQMKIAEKKLERILKLREELRDLENVETSQKPETSRTRIYNWATHCTNTNQYEFLFSFKTGKPYQEMRDHFMSLDRETEMDLVWLYMIQVKGKKLFVLDSKNIKNPSGERMKLNRFASNVIDQILVYAGGRGETMFPGPITRQVASHSLLPKYVTVPKQPTEFDCEVHVLKYMEIVNPNDLGKAQFQNPSLEQRPT
ncbi:hypothetical protein PIB30_052665 [Stylosanthes scabra]|uniref:Ubiquitin-like protease family profile domain-containing protein n=1 Tax=Stylosanthes scabra TaxID=79078 RepID=A0ABU6QIY9_9FABA|nr:hypothetical protein [Stylosanthes scabra]